MKSLMAAAAALCIVCSYAQGQSAPPQSNPNVQARELAERLGRERDAEGLATILESRNVELLIAYGRGMRNTSVAAKPPHKMPPAIETLVVRYYDDPVIGGPLRMLATADRYQTRELFELFLREWRSGQIRTSTYPMRDSALRTDVSGVEEALIEWIESSRPPSTEDLKAIVAFLGASHYAPAVPLLTRLGREPAQLELAVTCVGALIEIGTAESMDAALARLDQMRSIDTPRAREARLHFLQRLPYLPQTVPIPYERLRATEPDFARQQAPHWLSKRKDPAAVADTLVLLSQPHHAAALEALVASDSPATWQRARDETERLHAEGRMSEPQYCEARTLLDQKLADPQKHFAKVEGEKRYLEYERRRVPIAHAKNEAVALKSRDPAAYFDAMRRQAALLEALAIECGDLPTGPGGGIPGDLANEFLVLGDFARLRLHRPREALELYASSERWGGGRRTAFAAADTLQFDLKDREGALAAYRKLLAQMKAPAVRDPQTEQLDAWTERWLEAQVAWLSNGRRFSGTIDETDLAGPQLAMMFAGGGGGEDPEELVAVRRLILPVMRRTLPPARVDAKELARLVAALPPSSYMLMRSAAWLPLMPDAASILAFLERSDPAGYVTGAFLAAVANGDAGGDAGAVASFLRGPDDAVEIPAPLRAAAAKFLRERRITYRLSPPATR